MAANFTSFSLDERRLVCEQAQAKSGLASASIEKDYWVWWTLRELFSLPHWGTSLTFKGGTSLSKCWKLIERFSEDIDVVVDRTILGVATEHPSVKAIERLKEACGRMIREELLLRMRGQIAEKLAPSDDWSLDVAHEDDDPDRQTLLFRYPSAFKDGSKYVKPVVRIELGARSEIEPAEFPSVESILAETLPELVSREAVPIRTITSARTFWEKAMLLHEETYRPEEKPRKSRLSRHYYDVWCLFQKGIASDAAQNVDLFNRVAAHRRAYFRYGWLDYATLQRGTLRVAPLPSQEPFWRRDYEQMRGEMFYGEPPRFDVVLDVVREFFDGFNGRTS
ncbi:MAG: nucleotidyl transferase AbiEii/AbiGii toxin family protein [Phycisphaerae bacterium]|nr:nucleotidyl transferase AbiEii/AbiGii toxin family protein [Phycisphaerae bacterium]